MVDTMHTLKLQGCNVAGLIDNSKVLPYYNKKRMSGNCPMVLYVHYSVNRATQYREEQSSQA